MSPDITVRSLAGDAEYEWAARLTVETFGHGPATAEHAQREQRWIKEDPDFRPEQWRGAFLDGRPAGSYLAHERLMSLGSGWVPTLCVGTVVTHPDFRGRGVGRAMMEDAIRFAVDHRKGLLLLDGAAGFYGRFGYADVLDEALTIISRSAIQALPAGSCTVRPATTDDAVSLRAMYVRHFGRFTGGFQRSSERQFHLVSEQLGRRLPVMCIDAAGNPCGYLLAWRHPGYAGELAADSWDALLTLLHHADAETERLDPSETELHWLLPPGSPEFYWLADRILPVDPSPRDLYPRRHAAVVSSAHHYPNSGWEARPADLDVLFEALVPVWQQRWTRRRELDQPLRLEVDGRSYSIQLGAEVQLTSGRIQEPDVTLTSQALMQLIFGYRPAWWFAEQPGCSVPEDAVSILDVLFPMGHAWIPGTDWF